MLQDISKKLTMKKTFFTTQLEGFFNSITQEYNNLIHELEVEKRLIEEKASKLEKDVENLVEIKKNYEKSSQIDKRRIQELQETLAKSRNIGSSAYTETLQNENATLKKELESLKSNHHDSQEVQQLQENVDRLKGFLAKGANPYQDNLMSEKKEDIIKEISESLKK